MLCMCFISNLLCGIRDGKTFSGKIQKRRDVSRVEYIIIIPVRPHVAQTYHIHLFIFMRIIITQYYTHCNTLTVYCRRYKFHRKLYIVFIACVFILLTFNIICKFKIVHNLLYNFIVLNTFKQFTIRPKYNYLRRGKCLCYSNT